MTTRATLTRYTEEALRDVRLAKPLIRTTLKVLDTWAAGFPSGQTGDTAGISDRTATLATPDLPDQAQQTAAQLDRLYQTLTGPTITRHRWPHKPSPSTWEALLGTLDRLLTGITPETPPGPWEQWVPRVRPLVADVATITARWQPAKELPPENRRCKSCTLYEREGGRRVCAWCKWVRTEYGHYPDPDLISQRQIRGRLTTLDLEQFLARHPNEPETTT
jgi:hypothetical protein